MQIDMHFYATYTLARAAGIPSRDAKIIAHAAQYVDDSNSQDIERHPDGGMLYLIATAHHPFKAAWDSWVDHNEQRRVWVPFHFLPGGSGDTLEEKLLCIADSQIARKMIEHHIDVAAGNCPFGLQLLGIAAHVYMDTFAHYGFSGIGSRYNLVMEDSISLEVNGGLKRDMFEKAKEFAKKHGARPIESGSSQESVQSWSGVKEKAP